MNVYKRFFEVKTGQFFEAVQNQHRVNREAITQYTKIADQIGASKALYISDVKLVGFYFDEKPDRHLYKKAPGTSNVWWPKKNTKFGKDLNKQIGEVKTIAQGELLKSIGLSAHGEMCDGHYMYGSQVVYLPSTKPVCYVVTPWKDEDPEKLEQYKIDCAEKKVFSSDLEHLLWEAPAEFVEVKEWQARKAIDEYNESLK
jgi:hypothetical protein